VWDEPQAFRRHCEAFCVRIFAREREKKDKAAHPCHALCRARVVEEIQRRKGTRIAEHLKLVLSVLNRQSVELPERRFPPPQGGAGVPQSLGAVRRLVVARFYKMMAQRKLRPCLRHPTEG
jgi:hypothetical protein